MEGDFRCALLGESLLLAEKICKVHLEMAGKKRGGGMS